MLKKLLSCKNTWKRVNVASKYNVHTVMGSCTHTHTQSYWSLLGTETSPMCHQEGADSEEVRKRKEGAELLPCIVTLPLRLPSDDVHDGVL